MGRRSTLYTSEKTGATPSVGKSKDSYLKSYYARRRLLTVPDEILEANPDKHFCYVNMNKLQKNGMWHHLGYRLYKANEDTENLNAEKFTSAIDSYVHRNEMVLAYIPEEEYQERQLEMQIVRGKKSVLDTINKNPLLQNFEAHADEKVEKIKYEAQAASLSGGLDG